jgi:hypothetical protein
MGISTFISPIIPLVVKLISFSEQLIKISFPKLDNSENTSFICLEDKENSAS